MLASQRLTPQGLLCHPTSSTGLHQSLAYQAANNSPCFFPWSLDIQLPQAHPQCSSTDANSCQPCALRASCLVPQTGSLTAPGHISLSAQQSQCQLSQISSPLTVDRLHSVSIAMPHRLPSFLVKHSIQAHTHATFTCLSTPGVYPIGTSLDLEYSSLTESHGGNCISVAIMCLLYVISVFCCAFDRMPYCCYECRTDILLYCLKLSV